MAEATARTSVVLHRSAGGPESTPQRRGTTSPRRLLPPPLPPSEGDFGEVLHGRPAWLEVALQAFRAELAAQGPEAEREGWLREAEGLSVSIAAAEEKIAQREGR